MKISKPKPFAELVQSIKPEQWQLIGKYKAIDEQGRYLHWDKFKYVYPKNTEAAWLATKINRSSLLTELKIADISFFYAVPTSLQALLHFIDKMSSGNVGTNNFEGLSSTEQQRFLLKSLIMEEAITSAQLEGAATTRKVAKEMLESERKPKTQDEIMIFNNYYLMKEAIKLKNEPLSLEMILKLHRIATNDAIENNAVSGAFRQDNQICIVDYGGDIIHQPPEYEKLPELMQSFCDFVNTNHNDKEANFIHPVIKAIILHFLIGYIHPFGDGNGRTARALFYWFMLKNGYWLFEYISISRLLKEAPAKYAKAYLYTETDDLDITYFLYYQAEIVKRAILDLEKYISDKQNEFKAFSAAIVSYTRKVTLNSRQIQILQKAAKDIGAIFTAKEISNQYGIAENTARKDLNHLYQLNLFGQIRNGNAISYIAPNDLLERLKQ
ncbi:Fic family protein [Gallibacterium salpingitidis]|uniref:Fic family protein n=1 Tax=Gallibacterium salpingitidis TaxID=505341 RepID=UPI00266FF14F|nr:Fic family protein [Gallibacterium salpingitidis]WKT00130.1 Fic family protein [Gallibacterium salpingitidis]